MRALVVSLLTVALACSCDGGDGAGLVGGLGGGGSGGGSGGGTGGGGGGAYSGWATVTVDYPELSDRRVHTQSAWVEIGAPEAVGSVSESNPVNLSACSSGAGSAGDGDFCVFSAQVFQVDLGPTPVLLQYWSLASDGAGGMSGTLTDTHRAESMATNQLWAEMQLFLERAVAPFIMDRGATLQATVSASEVRLRVAGVAYSPDWLTDRPFVIDVLATR